ncbi:hypothetical protein CAPTEDRAFT_213165 [Capitella teleta]|uniref:Uncharacterized protein n=1 Tax=Capitella teleta TaxID=283909 RepID=R7TJM3_CAPTE|nr:hypothetical protein CAPTEDRAFT_213165 [Capitella teleta]|eukprot:ELT91741.1 hypothetical protein CAPTEDRAFT_213165 [Capitella teleta]
MFTPKLNSSRGRFTPLHTPNTSSTSLARTPIRKGNLTPQKRNAAGTPLWNHSLNSSALKSSDEGPQHTLEEFSGADLPLLVTETLTLDGREADVRFNPDGWAWLSYLCHSPVFVL